MKGHLLSGILHSLSQSESLVPLAEDRALLGDAAAVLADRGRFTTHNGEPVVLVVAGEMSTYLANSLAELEQQMIEARDAYSNMKYQVEELRGLVEKDATHDQSG